MSLHFQTLGEGAPLLIIHGLFGTSDNLKSIANELKDHFKIYLLDAPAHGKSPSTDSLSLESMAKQVKIFCEQHELTDISILGHSMGGKIAMELALRNPTLIKQLIVADIAPVKYPRRHDQIIAGLNNVDLTNLANRQQADKALAGYINEVGIRSFLLKSLVRSADNKWHWQFDLASIQRGYDNLIDQNVQLEFNKPCLFIIGGNSNYVLPEHKEQITSRFPQVKVKVIQNAGHWLHAEKPTAFAKICRDFLS